MANKKGGSNRQKAGAARRRTLQIQDRPTRGKRSPPTNARTKASAKDPVPKTWLP